IRLRPLVPLAPIKRRPSTVPSPSSLPCNCFARSVEQREKPHIPTRTPARTPTRTPARIPTPNPLPNPNHNPNLNLPPPPTSPHSPPLKRYILRPPPLPMPPLPKPHRSRLPKLLARRTMLLQLPEQDHRLLQLVPQTNHADHQLRQRRERQPLR